MDLYLRKQDFNEVFNLIKDHFGTVRNYGGGAFFARDGLLDKSNMEFAFDWSDTALFYHHHPYDAYDYNSIAVRSLYEVLIMLKKNKIPEADIIYEESAGEKLLNVGRMIENRQQLKQGQVNIRDSKKDRLRSPPGEKIDSREWKRPTFLKQKVARTAKRQLKHR